jgi:general stress protein CsbA
LTAVVASYCVVEIVAVECLEAYYHIDHLVVAVADRKDKPFENTAFVVAVDALSRLAGSVVVVETFAVDAEEELAAD